MLKKCSVLQGLEILSPKLVILKVSHCFGAFNFDDIWVRINTPRLHTLVWVNNPISSKNCVQNLVCLHEATIGFLVTQQNLDAKKLQSVSGFLSGLSHVVSLTLEGQFVEVFLNLGKLVLI